MKKTIKIEFKNQTTKSFEVLSLATNATNVVLRNYLEDNQPLFIEVGHTLLNTQLDASQVKSFNILYFNEESRFSGASYTDSNAHGDFSIITQSKKILIFPSGIDFELGEVHNILSE
jgi:hypothetical protein